MSDLLDGIEIHRLAAEVERLQRIIADAEYAATHGWFQASIAILRSVTS